MFNKKEKIAITIISSIFIAIYFAESKKESNSEMLEKIHYYFPLILFISVAIYHIWDNGKLDIVELNLNDNIFVTWLVICFLITWYILYNEEDAKLRVSAKKAFIALILAFCSRIKVVFAPFFLVLAFSYYM